MNKKEKIGISILVFALAYIVYQRYQQKKKKEEEEEEEKKEDAVEESSSSDNSGSDSDSDSDESEDAVLKEYLRKLKRKLEEIKHKYTHKKRQHLFRHTKLLTVPWRALGEGAPRKVPLQISTYDRLTRDSHSPQWLKHIQTPNGYIVTFGTTTVRNDPETLWVLINYGTSFTLSPAENHSYRLSYVGMPVPTTMPLVRSLDTDSLLQVNNRLYNQLHTVGTKGHHRYFGSETCPAPVRTKNKNTGEVTTIIPPCDQRGSLIYSGYTEDMNKELKNNFAWYYAEPRLPDS